MIPGSVGRALLVSQFLSVEVAGRLPVKLPILPQLFRHYSAFSPERPRLVPRLAHFSRPGQRHYAVKPRALGHHLESAVTDIRLRDIRQSHGPPSQHGLLAAVWSIRRHVSVKLISVGTSNVLHPSSPKVRSSSIQYSNPPTNAPRTEHLNCA